MMLLNGLRYEETLLIFVYQWDHKKYYTQDDARLGPCCRHIHLLTQQPRNKSISHSMCVSVW